MSNAELNSNDLFADWHLDVVCPYCYDHQQWEGRDSQDCGECLQQFRIAATSDDVSALCARAIFNGGYLSEVEIAAIIREFFQQNNNWTAK